MAQITTKEQFTNSLHKGDVFYWIDCDHNGKPTVVRRSRVVEIVMHGRILNVRHTWKDEIGRAFTPDSAVGDLIRGNRAVYTSEQEANDALLQRKQEIQKNPQLPELRRREAYSDAMSDIDDRLACAAV